ncbi:MAG: serine/threonine protein kinase [Acetatifactor sp.]
MDITKICLGCMREISYAGGICPYCGYYNSLEQDKTLYHHLKPYSILAGKYLVGKVLREDGFSITYIGLDLNLEMKVTIKEFYPNGFVTRQGNSINKVTDYADASMQAVQKWKEDFIHEAKILAKCSNLSGIVGVKDFFQENNTAYIIMEYLEGETLKEHLKKKGGKLPLEEVLEVMRPVISSLAHMHEQGLIHRDISPDNIMMLSEGNVKLLDLGVVRDYATEGEKSLSVMPKPGYAPEEQYRTKGKQGPWSDVYALCATMYKCITGITPPESMNRIRDDDLKKPSALGITIEKDIEEILLQGMEIFAEKRIQNMNELYRALYENGRNMKSNTEPSQIILEKTAPAKKEIKVLLEKVKQFPSKYYYEAGAVAAILVLIVVVFLNGVNKKTPETEAIVEKVNNEKAVMVEETKEVEEETQEDNYASIEEAWKKIYIDYLENLDGTVQSISLIRIEKSSFPIMKCIVNTDNDKYRFCLSYIDGSGVVQQIIRNDFVSSMVDGVKINKEDRILYTDGNAEYIYSFDTDTESYRETFNAQGPYYDAAVHYYHICDYINDIEEDVYDEEEYDQWIDFFLEIEATWSYVAWNNVSDEICEFNIDEYFAGVEVSGIGETDVEDEKWKKAYIDYLKGEGGVIKSIELYKTDKWNAPLLVCRIGGFIPEDDYTYNLRVCFVDASNTVQEVYAEDDLCIAARDLVIISSDGDILIGMGSATFSQSIYSYNDQTNQYQNILYISGPKNVSGDNCYEIDGIMYLEDGYKKKRMEALGSSDYILLDERAEWQCEAEENVGVDIVKFFSGIELE